MYTPFRKGAPAEIPVRPGPRTSGRLATADLASVLPDTEPLRPPAPMSPRGRRLLWMIGGLALILRLLLLPLGHWWDLTVDYNVFIDLAHNHSPYETFLALSHIARASRWETVYEYYAYPPVPLYLYYPLAKLYLLFHPQATYFSPVSGQFAVPNLTLDFFFLLKAPIWLADFLLAALLARLSGTIRGARDYLLNPYVLLISGAWTFDAIMVLGLVAGVYFILRDRPVWSALALAFGTMVKFFPILAVPTIAIYLLRRRRPWREILLFLGIYLAACLALLGPFAQGVLAVLNFHSSRAGGGMTWVYYWTASALFRDADNLRATLLTVSSFGTPLLAIALLLTWWHLLKTEMPLNRMMLITLLGFFAGSKLINEQYALMLIPFAWLEARRLGGVWRWLYHLFWLVPLAFAAVHAPLDRFFWLYYHMLMQNRAAITVSGATGFDWSLFPWNHLVDGQRLSLLLACSFFLLVLVALCWPVRLARKGSAHSQKSPCP